MSDEKPKSKRGFAANPQNINRQGRRRGSKNKLPTNQDLINDIKSCNGESLEVLKKIMRDDKHKEQFKAAVKIFDTSVNLTLEEEKIILRREEKGLDGKNKTTEYEVENGAVKPKTGTDSGSGKVYSLVSTEYTGE